MKKLTESLFSSVTNDHFDLHVNNLANNHDLNVKDLSIDNKRVKLSGGNLGNTHHIILDFHKPRSFFNRSGKLGVEIRTKNKTLYSQQIHVNKIHHLKNAINSIDQFISDYNKEDNNEEE